MDTTADFGFKELFTFLIGDIVKAISDRFGETKQQQLTRSQAAVRMIMGLQPRDVIEAMLAGHCVMFHALMIECLHETLRSDRDARRRGSSNSIVALNTAFLGNLQQLGSYQSRPSEGQIDWPEVRLTDAQAARAEQASRPVAATSVPPAAPQAGAPPTVMAGTLDIPAGAVIAEPRNVAAQVTAARVTAALTGSAVIHGPSPERLVEVHANQAAMAALEVGDAAAFARAMGVEQPSAEFLAAAAAPGSPFDRQAKGPWPTGDASDGEKT